MRAAMAEEGQRTATGTLRYVRWLLLEDRGEGGVGHYEGRQKIC